MEKLKKYFIVTILTIVILYLTLFINNIFPFGPYDIASVDGVQQYKPFLYNLIMNIKYGTLESYSFIGGLGNPTVFNAIYYLFSPLNFIAIFFKNPDSMFLSVITIKTIITSIITTFYFSKRTNNNYLSIICSLLYTFSGWYIAYHYSIMWLDAFMIFPLFQYGLEELIDNNRYLTYILSLSYIMYTNFYLAFTICLYTLVYYFFHRIIKKEKYLYKIKNFDLIFISTIMACLISCFIITMVYNSFLKMGIIINEVESNELILTIPDLFKSLLTGSTNIALSEETRTFPNICSSLIVLISLFYFFINDKIQLKERLTNLLYLILIIILLKSPYLNYIINCFHTPIGYAYRYSFIITFYLLKIFIQNIKTITNKINPKIFIVIAIIMLLTILEYVFNDLQSKLLIINIIFLVSYSIIIFFYNKNKFSKYLLIALIFFELLISAQTNFTKNHLLTEYPSFDSTIYQYRDNQPNIITLNDNYYTNINNLSYFSSMQYNSTINNLNFLGCSTDNKATIDPCYNTKVFNMLYNIKNDDYYLEKIYAIKNNQDLYNEPNSVKILEYQNSLLEEMTDIKDIFSFVEPKVINNTDNTYIYQMKENHEYYLQTNLNIKTVKINEQEQNIASNQKLLIFELKKNDTIEIEFKNDNHELFLYKLDEKKLQKAYEYLKDNQITYTKYTNSHLEGDITTEDDEIIFTTIPYDESWEITIDGNIIKPEKLLDNFIGIKTTAGSHHLVLKYKEKHTISLMISIISLIATITFYYLKKRRSN